MTTSLDRIPVDTLPAGGDQVGRRKLWQLDRSWHDNLIGTCLAPREIKAQCRKLLIAVQPTGGDEFRRALVEVAGAPSPPARRLHKHLDRKYWRIILRFTSATSAAALEALWRETASSDAAGAYWALVTHPHASASLIERVQGKADDRVRRGGHAIRVDDRTLRRLQRANEAVAGHRSEAGSGGVLQECAGGRLPGQGSRSTSEDHHPAAQPAAAQEIESLLRSLRTQVEDYAAKLALERARAERAEASAREWRRLAILYKKRHRPCGGTGNTSARRTQKPRGQKGRGRCRPPAPRV